MGAEEQIYAAVLSGELTIDAEGRVWRVAARRTDRWSGRTKIIPCEPRRAENRLPLGYLQVRVMIAGKRHHALAHRLVWRHFNGPIPPGKTVNHRNGEKATNRLSNLELATPVEQTRHAREVLGRHGTLSQSGERNHRAKLTDAQVATIRARRAAGEPLASIAADFGIAFQHVSKIARRTARNSPG